MRTVVLFVALLSSVVAFAGEKAVVTLGATSYSVSGGMFTRNEVDVRISRSYSADPVPLPEVIAALESKLGFYRMIQHNKVDHMRVITAEYVDAPLKSVLGELLPGVPVRFDGVDEGVTLRKLSAKEVRLEVLLQYLDEAAGVSIAFGEAGITVTDPEGE